MNRLAARLLRAGGWVLVGMLSFYFLYHAIYGQQGLRRHQALEAEVGARTEALEKLRAERTALEKRTNGLRPESLDPDLLEEQARRQLGFGKDGERIILTPQR